MVRAKPRLCRLACPVLEVRRARVISALKTSGLALTGQGKCVSYCNSGCFTTSPARGVVLLGGLTLSRWDGTADGNAQSRRRKLACSRGSAGWAVPRSFARLFPHAIGSSRFRLGLKNSAGTSVGADPTGSFCSSSYCKIERKSQERTTKL